MHRYAECFRGRIILELACYINVDLHKQAGEIGEKALCNAIYFLYRLENINKYKFLQSDFVNSFVQSLISLGEMISTLVDLSITRVCTWFSSSLLLLTPRQRSLKLVELDHVICEYLLGTRTDLNVPAPSPIVGSSRHQEVSSDLEMHKILCEKVIMSQLLNFSDTLLEMIDFHTLPPDVGPKNGEAFVEEGDQCNAMYDEEALLLHIQSCYSIVRHISDGTLATKIQEACQCPLVRISLSGGGNEDLNKTTPLDAVAVSSAALDAVRSSCQSSALKAVVACVDVLSLTLRPVLDTLLHEERGAKLEITSSSMLSGTSEDYSNGSGGWIGGDACKCLLYRVKQWITCTLESIPSECHALLCAQACKMLVIVYVEKLIMRHDENKKSNMSFGFSGTAKLTLDGINQLSADLSRILHWMATTCSFSLQYGAGMATSPRDVILSEIVLSDEMIPEAIQDTVMLEYKLVQVLICYFSAKELRILDVFATSVAYIGIKQMYALYDLLRLVLKIRLDVSTRSRKERLCLCGEFMTHLQYASTVDHSLLENDVLSKTNMRGAKGNSSRFGLCIFDTLCPHVGTFHCTGKKWSIESLNGNTHTDRVRLHIASLVTDTSTLIRQRRKLQSDSKAPKKKSSFYTLNSVELGVVDTGAVVEPEVEMQLGDVYASRDEDGVSGEMSQTDSTTAATQTAVDTETSSLPLTENLEVDAVQDASESATPNNDGIGGFGKSGSDSDSDYKDCAQVQELTPSGDVEAECPPAVGDGDVAAGVEIEIEVVRADVESEDPVDQVNPCASESLSVEEGHDSPMASPGVDEQCCDVATADADIVPTENSSPDPADAHSETEADSPAYPAASTDEPVSSAGCGDAAVEAELKLAPDVEPDHEKSPMVAPPLPPTKPKKPSRGSLLSSADRGSPAIGVHIARSPSPILVAVNVAAASPTSSTNPFDERHVEVVPAFTCSPAGGNPFDEPTGPLPAPPPVPPNPFDDESSPPPVPPPAPPPIPPSAPPNPFDDEPPPPPPPKPQKAASNPFD